MDVKGLLAEYGLTEETYEAMLKDTEDKVNKSSDLEWADILEKYDIPMHYDTVRKACQPPLFGSTFVSEYYKQKMVESSANGNDAYLDKVNAKIQELKKERYKLNDERTELNKALRSEARLEDRLDKLEAALTAQGREEYEIQPITEINSDNDLIVMLSDLHLGAEYYSFTGCYNSDIAKERLNTYLNEIIKIQKRHSSENCHVILLGDEISGNIHSTIAVSNRENVIEQVKKVSDLVADFVYELSKVFKNVYLSSVNGNHSRLTRKEDAVKDERLDALVPWYVNAKLGCIPNVDVNMENLDSTITLLEVRGNTYAGVHGDYDSFTDAGVSKLCMWLGYRPYCILYGHKHFPAMSECAGVVMVQSGSLGGCGDDFTTQHRLKGEASQTVLVCDTNGIQACYPIKFGLA